MVTTDSSTIPKNTEEMSHRRLAALDGLRGIAAAIVVVFHYLCMLHPWLVPLFSDSPYFLADTPLAILWNGHFAVSVFFVLSGFVMAAAAERRKRFILLNTLTRYLRLAIPVTVSVMLAWLWLSLFPTAAGDLAASKTSPSLWLSYTAQAPLPSFLTALLDGAVLNFVTGGSLFNNALWTMKIELLGSVVLFVVYWLSGEHVRWRLLLLAVFALVVLFNFLLVELFRLPDWYLCFVTGALLYEAHRRGLLERVPVLISVAALAAGLVLGAAGLATGERLGLPPMPWRLALGNPWGLVPVMAATMLLFAALTLTHFKSVLVLALPQWLGRVSFSLYLVHVPLLYTFVAYARLAFDPPEAALIAGYAAMTLALAHVFTLLVDEPSLRLLRRLRLRLEHGVWQSVGAHAR